MCCGSWGRKESDMTELNLRFKFRQEFTETTEGISLRECATFGL